MYYDVLGSVKKVVDKSKHVSINQNNIDKVLPLMEKSEKKPWLDSDYLDIDQVSIKDKVLFMLICESLNFCFYGPIKWKIEHNGEWYSGSYGLFYAVSRAIKEGKNLLDANYLEHLTIEDLDYIFRGTTTIPLLEERLDLLRELALEIKEVGNVYDLFMKARSDRELLSIIVDNFKNFRDISTYKGETVFFFKRATLLVEDLYQNVPSIKSNIGTNTGLYGCADYKIPQVMRNVGILEYDEELSKIIDDEDWLAHDSEMEIEIRANMIYAIELIKESLSIKGIDMTSIEIDNELWLLSKDKTQKSKPHHLTKTIYY